MTLETEKHKILTNFPLSHASDSQNYNSEIFYAANCKQIQNFVRNKCNLTEFDDCGFDNFLPNPDILDKVTCSKELYPVNKLEAALPSHILNSRVLCDLIVQVNDREALKKRSRRSLGSSSNSNSTSNSPFIKKINYYCISHLCCEKSELLKSKIIENRIMQKLQPIKTHYAVINIPDEVNHNIGNIISWIHTGRLYVPKNKSKCEKMCLSLRHFRCVLSENDLATACKAVGYDYSESVSSFAVAANKKSSLTDEKNNPDETTKKEREMPTISLPDIYHNKHPQYKFAENKGLKWYKPLIELHTLVDATLPPKLLSGCRKIIGNPTLHYKNMHKFADSKFMDGGPIKQPNFKKRPANAAQNVYADVPEKKSHRSRSQSTHSQGSSQTGAGGYGQRNSRFDVARDRRTGPGPWNDLEYSQNRAGNGQRDENRGRLR